MTGHVAVVLVWGDLPFVFRHGLLPSSIFKFQASTGTFRIAGTRLREWPSEQDIGVNASVEITCPQERGEGNAQRAGNKSSDSDERTALVGLLQEPLEIVITRL